MDLIAAIATGSAPTAIGILRLSGDGCFDACEQVFRAVNGTAFSAQPPRCMVYGDLLDAQGRRIDRGLAVRFPGPHSYTGEDCAEFHCHGSPVVLRELLAAVQKAGARQALPGEFTRRAFLSGRMDLTQAEAVADLIDAESAAAARNAAGQLTGALRRGIEAVYQSLLELSAQLCAVVDYPDEDIADLDTAATDTVLSGAEQALDRLLATCQRGRILKSGVRTAIIGRPNAGKSSLLNALAGYERCLVTDIPGTTRDTVEESVSCAGVPLRLVDTAGIRDTEDTVERLGVQRARQAVAEADLVLAVFDASRPLTDEDRRIRDLAAEQPRWILIFSKKDLAPPPDAEALCPPDRPGTPPAAVVALSSRTGEGLEALEAAVAALFPEGSAPAGEILTNARQQDAASRARDAVSRARTALRSGLTPDAALSDVEDALNALGELSGRTAREDLVDRIFARVCVGK